MKNRNFIRFSSLFLALIMLLSAFCVIAEAKPAKTVRYDNNGDGEIDISDVTETLNYLSGSFEGDPAVFDDNGDGNVDIADVTALLNFLSFGCNHATVVTSHATAATCTEPGYGEGSYCADCGLVFAEPEETEPALGHLYENGFCGRCGIRLIEVGDELTFGRYEQDNDTENGAEPITWTVVALDGGRATLVSKYILDAKKFDTSDPDAEWDECSIRDFLNGEFLDAAFTAEEQGQIAVTEICDRVHTFHFMDYETEDKVFLLSNDEATAFFGTSLECAVTPYAQATGIITSHTYIDFEEALVAEWWLRVPGENDGAMLVTAIGSIRESGVTATAHAYGVRPAVNLDLCAVYGHNVVTDPAVAADCIYDGKTEGSHCATCGEVFVAQEIIPSEGKHSFVDGACVRCGAHPMTVGETFYFGRTEQDNDTSNGAEPIEWLVLDIQNGKALVVSQYVLAMMHYLTERGDYSWDQSAVRPWLNDNLYNTAFTDEERSFIHLTHNEADDYGDATNDYLFLLTRGEAETYFNADWYTYAVAAPTAYALASSDGGSVANDYQTVRGEFSCSYFLRSSSNGNYHYTYDSVLGGYIHWLNFISYNSKVGHMDTVSQCYGVRPAMWVDLCAAGHSPVTDEAVTVNCYHDGVTEGSHCAVCGKVFVAQEVIPTLGHIYVNGVCENCGKHAPAVGESYFFGSCEQDNDTTNGAEPIEWTVMKIDGGKALLLSRYVLALSDYHATGSHPYWSESTPNIWLNGDFYNGSFTDDERALIRKTTLTGDRVEENVESESYIFILKWSELDEFFADGGARLCAPTPYAVGTNEWVNGYHEKTDRGEYAIDYWVRTVGGMTYYSSGVYFNYMTYVDERGAFEEDSPNKSHGIRPAMWVNLCADGHHKVIDEAVAPTCTGTGLTAGSHCAACGLVLEAQQIVEPTGHGETVNHRCAICGDEIYPEDMEFILGDDGYIVAPYKGCAKDVYIPSTYQGVKVTSIYNDAFLGNEYIETLTLSNNMRTIYSQAFCNCPNLREVNLGTGVTRINRSAFGNCASLESVTIPASVTALEGGAFTGPNLTSITVDSRNSKYYSVNNCVIKRSTSTLVIGTNSSIIPTDGSVVAIGEYAFARSGITSITIPGVIKNIGDCAFAACQDLTEVILQQGVKVLDTRAFYMCPALENIYFPVSIAEIHTGAFYKCNALANVYYAGVKNRWEKLVTVYTQSNAPLLAATFHYEYTY